MRGDEGAAEGDEGIGGDGRHTCCGDEGTEGDGGGQDGAEQERGDGVHDDDGVFGLLFVGNLRDPAREGENTVSSNGPDKTRRGHT